MCCEEGGGEEQGARRVTMIESRSANTATPVGGFIALFWPLQALQDCGIHAYLWKTKESWFQCQQREAVVAAIRDEPIARCELRQAK